MALGKTVKNFWDVLLHTSRASCKYKFKYQGKK